MLFRPTSLLMMVCCTLLGGALQAQTTLEAGSARLWLSPKGGDRSPPPASGREGKMLQQAAPTNQWYSSLLFSKEAQPLYAQPLTGRAAPGGFEMALPLKQVVPTERKDNEIQYPHRAAITVRPTHFEPVLGRLSRVGDWSIDIAMGPGPQRFDLTMAHGSPYVWGKLSEGDLQVTTASTARRIEHPDSRMLLLEFDGQRYAAFGPTGVRWEASAGAPGVWVARMPAQARHFVLTALPDETPQSLALVMRHAYVRQADTQVQWRFDNPSQTLTTEYRVTPEVLEGSESRPLLALYPHHWHGQPGLQARLGPAYASVRGPLKLLADTHFTTSMRHRGFVPYWPKVETAEGDLLDTLQTVIRADVRDARRNMLQIGKGPYWQGKGLLRTTKLLDVVEMQGDPAQSERLLAMLKERIEEWFQGNDRQRYFHLDRTLGTVLAYPEEYFAVEQMNDHHFHYGYWIRAMAELSLRDPQWAGAARWGGMVPWLIRDIAHPERHSADFPFLRSFDVYEGHSWASGVALGELGNNQESSSEAINAWVGLILWGERTGDTALRDLGIYLYNTEIEAIRHYWFDVHRLVFAPEYPHVETSMVFGGGYRHNTWWTDEPRQIKGINLLPITTASTYLGLDPEHTRRSLATLPGDTQRYESRGKRAKPRDIWQDLFAKYMALTDPAAGLAQWDRWGSTEAGDSRSHALHFMLSLRQMGVPDFSVWADTPLHAVFRQTSGQRTYLAFNAGATPKTVRFSDGTSFEVPAGQLGRKNP